MAEAAMGRGGLTVGVPRERAEGEHRVALIPDAVKRLTGSGVTVLVEAGAGAGASIADAAFEAGVDALARSIDRWDTGWWSAYDLHPHRVRNVASVGYHALHVAQLEALHALAPRPQLAETAARWTRYGESRANRARAWGGKIAFRVAVPRNRRVAAALPWARAR